ncbi:FHAD1 protein, partial [Penelope pileata]|nr:FHAD1 protein [Penelope pileata]
QDEQLKILRDESKVLKQKVQEEIAEYKEQIKQHARTIVALEDRLLEAEQQQKTLKKENDVLMERIEGKHRLCQMNLSVGAVSCVSIFLMNFREELAAVQSILQAKEAAIVALTRELSETRARMSDMRGELSEKQKAELEESLHRVKSQERDLSVLRGKLSEMSDLVARKDRELQAAAAELRKAERQSPLISGCSEAVARAELPTGTWGRARLRLGENHLGLEFQELALELAELGTRCRGLRHEETIQRQKEGLAELRERIKVLEKTRALVATSRAVELLKAGLQEKGGPKAGLEVEPALLPGARTKCSKVRSSSHGATSEAMSVEASDLDERMYLDLICALGSLMNMKELAEMQPMKHLPQEEREKAEQKRQRDLKLLYEKISKLKSRLEMKEETLREHEAHIEQLRLNQESLQTCQEEMLKLEDEVYRGAEEKALLREALERTRAQLGQEKRLQRAARQHRV